MSDFSFSATAECDECGRYLSSSDEECDHNGFEAKRRVFRRMGEGRSSLKAVDATYRHMWDILQEALEDEWIAYEYIGTVDEVNYRLKNGWDSVEDLPTVMMSLDV